MTFSRVIMQSSKSTWIIFNLDITSSKKYQPDIRTFFNRQFRQSRFGLSLYLFQQMNIIQFQRITVRVSISIHYFSFTLDTSCKRQISLVMYLLVCSVWCFISFKLHNLYSDLYFCLFNIAFLSINGGCEVWGLTSSLIM